MRDTAPSTLLSGLRPPLTISSPQPALPADITMDDSLNETKDSQRRSDLDESMLESSSAISDNLQDTASAHESDAEPMDISNKTATTVDSDNHSDCSSPLHDKYNCPICEIPLSSQHEFTLHIRSHNNENDVVPEKGFTCRVCFKILSSSSSLDRHVLVHSGERPFRCKICAVTFTTNGNMHRHMRTHSIKSENYESDASTDSNASTTSNGKTRKRRLEFNNNNTKLMESNYKRKSDCFEDDDNCVNRRKAKNINNNNNINEMVQRYHCPVCSRNDFASLNVLETHLEDNHPEYEAKCISCNKTFKNHRALTQHRYSYHYVEQMNNLNNKNTKNSIVGFKDLTFIDFSSEKFPHIARVSCEKVLHKPITEQKFICKKCQLAFPCTKTLEIHSEACIKNDNCNENYPTDLSKKSNISDEEIRRENFFAHLDLQNKSAPSSPSSPADEKIKIEDRLEPKMQPDNKDLADIQAILSMTSNGSLLQHLRTKPTSELMGSHDPNSADHQEEEVQDDFAAEFRKMKLRGEFPCRLCTQVFPNLRALKGHNRTHLTGSGNSGPYRCNMCPHTSIDKAAVMRHMRTHNGDRPYECSLCNYAFTTKANCERHLRNRHAKVTREDVKKAIIYHPSEDPTNEEINKLNVSRDDSKRSTLNSSADEDVLSDRMNSSTPKSLGVPEMRNLSINVPTTLLAKELSAVPVPKDHLPLLQVSKDLTLKDQRILIKEEHQPFQFSERSNMSLTPKYEEALKANPFENLKQIPDYETHSEDEDSMNQSSNFDDYNKSEHPMDLSMDVLDLSKKKESPKHDEPQDFTKKTLESSVTSPLPPTHAQLLLAQQLLKNPASFYASQLSQYYQNPGMFAGLTNLNIPSIPLAPFMFPSPFLNASPQELKERILRLQMSGGTIISEQFPPLTPERLQSLHQQNIPGIPDIKFPSFVKSEDEPKPALHINTQLSSNIDKLQSPKLQHKQDLSHSPNSVKMVIKNGVLMPKQKQRRYRTERPFSCEHCTARFTLRSNMERHIKQQHPQFWSQRQRSGISGAGRRPASAQAASTQPNVKPPYYDLNVPNYDLHMPKHEAIETKEKDNVGHHIPISQQVKYAILAQQLKARDVVDQTCSSKDRASQEDDEDALIIDEEKDEEEKISKTETKDNATEFKPIENKSKTLEDKMLELRQIREKQLQLDKPHSNLENGPSKNAKNEEGQDLVSVARILDNAVSSQIPFREYFCRDGDENDMEGISEEDEESMIASGSTSEGNGSGTDENKSEGEASNNTENGKKKSAYSLAPNRVSCPYCNRKFPWTSSLRRHVLTHTGQKPFKCLHCPLLFTTKSNCDRHLLRKHGSASSAPADAANNQNYMMRNVPERPFKCSNCPSSTFSTLSNLRKHMSCKHTHPGGGDAQKADEHQSPGREYESHGSSEDERLSKTSSKSDWEHQISQKAPAAGGEQPSGNQNADLPFKCHLCDNSFGERQEALDHIRDVHASEYELLMSKGALDQNATGDEINHNHETEDDDHLRGKFPDYANRKVICAYCMRRFWSAEDLRRHMRTHTGERPFSCDVCRRRFTLKHSMLRHRKKHNFASAAEDGVAASGDEDASPAQVPYDKHAKVNNNNNLVEKQAEKSGEDDSEGNEGNDLIGNLLGIRDKSIIDRVLVSSADDAAKLLGVNHGQE